MDSGRLDINILGISFSIQADESEEYLKSVYDYYVERVNQVDKTVNGQLEAIKVAIIAGILLADELKKERSHIKQLAPDEQERLQVINETKKIIEKLDDVLKDEYMG